MEVINRHIFREYDIRGVIGKDLTEPVVRLLGQGIGSFFIGHGVHRISLGRDGRLSSPQIRDWLLEGLISTGLKIVDLGLIPTPLSYYSTHRLDIGGAVMITGSHNPPEFNGFKVTLGREAIYGSAIQSIYQIIERQTFAHDHGSVEPYDIIPTYLEDISQRLHLERPINLVIDCGNGVASLTAPYLLKELGCSFKVLYGEVDGNFPHHHPDPTVEANLADLKKEVVEGGYELGIAYDGDGDRIGVIDEKGGVLWGDQLLAILARDLLKNNPGATVISEVKGSQRLFDDIAKHGGVPIMWKVGHSLIKKKMAESGALLAGEMSGHIFYRDRFYGFDDAVYVTGRLLEILAKSPVPLSQMLKDWPPTLSTPEIRVECPDEVKFQVVEAVKHRLARRYKIIDVDGVRVIKEGGWGLLRASNTQPVLVMRFEAETQELLDQIKKEVEEILEEEKSRLSP